MFSGRAVIARLPREMLAEERPLLLHERDGVTESLLLAAHEYLANHYDLERDEKRHLRYDALRGVELVDGVTRLHLGWSLQSGTGEWHPA